MSLLYRANYLYIYPLRNAFYCCITSWYDGVFFFLDDVIMCLFACVLYCAWHWVKVVCSTQSLLSMSNIYVCMYVCAVVLSMDNFILVKIKIKKGMV